MEQILKIGDKVKTAIMSDTSTGIIIDEGVTDDGEESYEINFDDNRTYTLPKHFLIKLSDKYDKHDGSFNHDLFLRDSVSDLRDKISKCSDKEKLESLKMDLNYLLRD